MGRPLYETSEHLARERAIAREIERLWKCNADKLPITYHLDYVLTRIEGSRRIGQAFLELKSRRKKTAGEVDRLGGYLLNLSKLERARTLVELSQLPFLVAVEFADGVYFAKFDAIPKVTLVVGGRSDRNDWQDKEPAALLDMRQFKRLPIDTALLDQENAA